MALDLSSVALLAVGIPRACLERFSLPRSLPGQGRFDQGCRAMAIPDAEGPYRFLRVELISLHRAVWTREWHDSCDDSVSREAYLAARARAHYDRMSPDDRRQLAAQVIQRKGRSAKAPPRVASRSRSERSAVVARGRSSHRLLTSGAVAAPVAPAAPCASDAAVVAALALASEAASAATALAASAGGASTTPAAGAGASTTPAALAGSATQVEAAEQAVANRVAPADAVGATPANTALPRRLRYNSKTCVLNEKVQIFRIVSTGWSTLPGDLLDWVMNWPTWSALFSTCLGVLIFVVNLKLGPVRKARSR